MIDPIEKGRAFRDLHRQDNAFVIPNPWDAGSARLLAGLGFRALATTSFGFATSLGQRDGQPGRDAVIAHGALLAAATDLPVSPDLENGFGHEPEAVAETIRHAGAAGLMGHDAGKRRAGAAGRRARSRSASARASPARPTAQSASTRS